MSLPVSIIARQRPGTFWVRELNWPAPDDVAPRVTATFKRIGVDAAEALAQAMGLDDAAVVRQRFAGGRRCYAAYVEGTLAAYGWVSLEEEWIGEQRLCLRLREGEAYIWDCATRPAYRRRRLYTALLAHINRALYTEGSSRVWIGADKDNVASKIGIELAGFKPVIDLAATDIFVWRFLRAYGRPDISKVIVADACRALLGHPHAWRVNVRQTSDRPHRPTAQV